MSLQYIVTELFKGFGVSLEIFFFTMVFALPLGLIVCMCEMCRFKPLAYLTKIYVWIIRGTPLMLQIIVIFYVPDLLGLNIGSAFEWLFQNSENADQKVRMMFVIIAFVINYSAYFAEIFRGGIQSVSKGQYEAGQLLGLNKRQTFFNIILPQVYKRTLAPMSNEIITLVKDTSLARIIGILELIMVAQNMMSRSGLVWPLLATGLFYLIFIGLLTLLFSYLEKKSNYYK